MNGTRRDFCRTMAGAGAVAAQAQSRAPEAARKPNIIVILADDLGYADVSAYKMNRFSTPNIDRIGSEGVRFTDGYATAPVCGPSRAGLMTGRYQQRFGFEYNTGEPQIADSQGRGMATGEVTIAQLLKDAGYRTGLIGKWHLGGQAQLYPTNRGFDEFVGFLTGQTSYINPKHPGLHVSFGLLGDNAVNIRAPSSASNDDLGQGIYRIGSTFRRGRFDQIVEGAKRRTVHNEDVYLTDYFGDRATDFIHSSSKSGQPYFLYLAFNAVHAPHMATAEYYDRFPEIQNHQARVYAAMIAALDEQVGRVVKAADASGDTLIYFSSDNGCAMYFPELCSCEPLRGGKLSHYEGGVRVPFLMRWPGHIQPGTVYRGMVSLLDVLPTSAAAAGVKVPGDRAFDGVDLVPYLGGDKTGSPHSMLAWRRLPLYSIRAGDWKLWESVDDTTGKYGNYKLLFNLQDDLNETMDLSAQNPQKVQELEEAMREWAKELVEPKWPSRTPVTYDCCGRRFTLPI